MINSGSFFLNYSRLIYLSCDKLKADVVNKGNIMKIATKLGLSFCAVLLMTAIVGIFSIYELAKVNEISTRLSSRWLPSVRIIEDVKSQIARIRTREFQYIISSDPADMDKYDKVIASDLEDLKKMQNEYESCWKRPRKKPCTAPSPSSGRVTWWKTPRSAPPCAPAMSRAPRS
jgi:hypothetical protein